MRTLITLGMHCSHCLQMPSQTYFCLRFQPCLSAEVEAAATASIHSKLTIIDRFGMPHVPVNPTLNIYVYCKLFVINAMKAARIEMVQTGPNESLEVRSFPYST